MPTTIKVKVNENVYVVKKPAGRVGAINMAILSKLAGSARQGEEYGEDKVLVSPAQQEMVTEVFLEWCEKVLPFVVVDGPFKDAAGKFVYDDMPGEDQMGVFMALMSSMNAGTELFQIITE